MAGIRKSPKRKQFKAVSRRHSLYFIGLDCSNNEWSSLNLRRLGLSGQTVKTLRRLACKFNHDQSDRKSTQVHAGTGQTESQVDTILNLCLLAFGQGFKARIHAAILRSMVKSHRVSIPKIVARNIAAVE